MSTLKEQLEHVESYDTVLNGKFGNLPIELVSFDNGATPESMAAYVLVSSLSKEMLKNKGSTALDLGNYIYRRFGLIYEPCPEYHRTGEPKNSIAFYISKRNMDRMYLVQKWLLEIYNEAAETKSKRYETALNCLHKIRIQGTSDINKGQP